MSVTPIPHVTDTHDSHDGAQALNLAQGEAVSGDCSEAGREARGHDPQSLDRLLSFTQRIATLGRGLAPHFLSLKCAKRLMNSPPACRM